MLGVIRDMEWGMPPPQHMRIFGAAFDAEEEDDVDILVVVAILPACTLPCSLAVDKKSDHGCWLLYVAFVGHALIRSCGERRLQSSVGSGQRL